MVQGTPEFFGLFEDMRIFGFLVDADELAILHQDLARADRRAAELAGHAEQNVAVDVFVGERGERLVVHDDDIRGGSGLQHAKLVREVFRGDLCIVLEEHVRHFAPRDVRQAGVQALHAERGLERFDHIVRPGVGTEAEQNPFAAQREHLGRRQRRWTCWTRGC